MLATAHACKTLDAGHSGAACQLGADCTDPGACPSPRLCSRLCLNCLNTCACTLGYSSCVCVCGASLRCGGWAGRRTHDAGSVAAICGAAIAKRTPSERIIGQQDVIGEEETPSLRDVILGVLRILAFAPERADLHPRLGALPIRKRPPPAPDGGALVLLRAKQKI